MTILSAPDNADQMKRPRLADAALSQAEKGNGMSNDNAKPDARAQRKKTLPVKARSSGPRLVTEEPRPWYEKFRIPAELIFEAQVLHIDDRRARREYELKAPKLWNLSGTVFSYFHRETGTRVYNRVRRDHFTGEGEDRKYIGNSAKQKQFERILYSAPGASERLKRKRTTRILVEAEKSVLAIEAWARRAERTDIVPLGMGGCNGWRDRQHGVLPDLNCCNGSPVVIMLDANVRTNKDVHEAELALIAELRSRGCTVTVARLPQEKGVNGPDDLLAQPDGDTLFAEVLRAAKGTAVAPYSEHALAERFATEHKADAIYVPNIGWHVWDGERWRPDDQGKVELLCQQLCGTAASERAKLTEQQRLRSRRTREAIMREAQGQLVVTNDLLDKDVMLLNTSGGTVNLHTGDLRPARREDYCTKLAGATPDKENKPERWLQFIDEITAGDKALGTYLQRIAGLCLTGDVSMQEVYFLHGTGANGKSVFVSTLLSILGDYGRTTPAETLMVTYHPQHATSIAALRGARLVAISEVEDGSRWAESKLKELTGGTPITARFMRMDEFTFMPQFKLVITGNHKPRLRNVDQAAERRLRLVPFTVQIPKAKRDRDLRKKLEPEYGGILQWAIEGCLDWQRQGLGTPDSVLSASAEYLAAQDVLGTWLNEQTTKKRSLREQSSVLYQKYNRWCEDAGEYVITQREFTDKMKTEKGFKTRKIHGTMSFLGIGLKAQPKFARRSETA